MLRKRVGSLKESNLKSLWNYFQFGVIWFLFKLFFSKNKINGNKGITIPFNVKLGENESEMILVI